MKKRIKKYQLLVADYRLRGNGFTLVELLVVIAISLIIAVAAVPIYGNLQVSSQLNDNSAQIVQTLRAARGRAEARSNNSPQGVFFEVNVDMDDRFILYQGDTYATRDSSYDQVRVLDASLSLSTTLTGDEVNFSRSLGIPSNTGTVTLTHDVQGSRTITINAVGVVEEN